MKNANLDRKLKSLDRRIALLEGVADFLKKHPDLARDKWQGAWTHEHGGAHETSGWTAFD
jgi:hypothetical protein